MSTKDLVMSLIKLDGPSGMEDGVAEYLREVLGGGKLTRLGSLVYEMKGNGKGKIGVFAHMDEIGMVVSSEVGDGFFYVERLGGVDPKILPSSKVKVFTRKGVLRGVIGIIAPHLTPPEERGKVQGFDDLVLDLSMSDWESVRPGDRVVLDVEPCESGNLVCGKALDNRAGCAVLVKVRDYLRKMKHGHDVYLVFSTQEEVGGPGARSVAYELDLDYAIVVDVTFAEKVPGHDLVKINEGPAIAVGPFVDRELFNLAMDVAKRHGVKSQVEALPMRTGTDTDAIRMTKVGVKTLLVSIPLLHMHTPVEVVSVDDIENAARLISHIIVELEG